MLAIDGKTKGGFKGAMGILSGAFLGLLLMVPCRESAAGKLRVVTTQATYASIASVVGAERVEVDFLVKGYQDPHFVRPKPSLAQKLANAELFVSTGLDLELWAPTLIDMSKNTEIRSGQRRFVSASHGIRLLEIPRVLSRGEGGVHIYGNPHIQTSPINAKYIAKNIMTGLIKVDPEGEKAFRRNYEGFCQEIDRRLYGEELIRLIGRPTLNGLAERAGSLWPFLEKNEYKGKKLVDYLGGWLEKAKPFRGKKVVAYHKNWAYFSELFGIKIMNYVEPKPSIPPSPRHVEEVIEQMKRESINVIIAANYYDENKVRAIADRVGAKAVILPVGVGGVPEAGSFFELMDTIISRIASAFS